MRRGRPQTTLPGRASWTALVLVATLAHGAEPPGAYVVEIDLTADIRALGADDPFVSEAAVEHLVALGPVTLPALARALGQESAEVRSGVVDVARQLDGPAAAALLVEAARDRDPTVRADALIAIGLGREAAGREVVEAALRDPDRRARRSAILACGQVCTSPDAFARLVELALGDSEAMAACQSLASAVADLDATRSERARAAVLGRAVPALADPDPARRRGAALVAALIGEPDAVPILAGAMRDGPAATAPQAALALGAVPTADAVAALDRAARGDAPAVANAACISLQRLQARAVPGAGAAFAACPAADTPAATPPSAAPQP